MAKIPRHISWAIAAYATGSFIEKTIPIVNTAIAGIFLIYLILSFYIDTRKAKRGK